MPNFLQLEHSWKKHVVGKFLVGKRLFFVSEIVTLTIVVKSWYYMACWCPLSLLNELCDYVVIDVIEKNNHFWVQLERPQCVVLLYLFNDRCDHLTYGLNGLINISKLK